MDPGRNDSPPPGDLASSSARLEHVVLEASKRHEEWPVKVAAGIYAALDLAISEPAALRGLALHEPAARLHASHHCARLIDRFAELLRDGAPNERRQAVSTDQAPVRAIAQIVTDHLRTDRQERLREVGPELVHLALLPYLGFDEAKRWAERTAGFRPGRD